MLKLLYAAFGIELKSSLGFNNNRPDRGYAIENFEFIYYAINILQYSDDLEIHTLIFEISGFFYDELKQKVNLEKSEKYLKKYSKILAFYAMETRQLYFENYIDVLNLQ